MKALEMNEKSHKNHWGILTRLLIPHLLIALEYATLYQSNAQPQYFYLMVSYEKDLLRIFMNINENIRN